MVILVDQDDVVADFDGGFLNKWREKYPDEFFVPLDRRKSFYTREDYPPHLRDKVENIYLAPGFYENIPPMPGAFAALAEMAALGHEVWICTAPLTKYENCVLEKFRWVDKHLGRNFTKKILLVNDKTFVRGDILIDDKPEIKGLFTPVWEHVVYDQPHNRHIVGKRRLTWDNWKQVLGL